ncbi:hypothetical protein Hanom_Chr11g01004221 [Helianthus anomalus]
MKNRTSKRNPFCYFTVCGVFAMRHVKIYNGSGEKVDCIFNKDKEIQDLQLENMRMKISTKFPVSEARRMIMFVNIWCIMLFGRGNVGTVHVHSLK